MKICELSIDMLFMSLVCLSSFGYFLVIIMLFDMIVIVCLNCGKWFVIYVLIVNMSLFVVMLLDGVCMMVGWLGVKLSIGVCL